MKNISVLIKPASGACNMTCDYCFYCDEAAKREACARVTTTDIAEHMGIPASTYEKWTGKSLDLKGNEIFVVYQRERFERNKVGIGYNTKNPLIYIGKARADLWLYIKEVAVPKVQYFTEKFKVVGTEDRILTGVFGSETCEHIIVFSDEYYQKKGNIYFILKEA